jgi:hypothetical protein
MKVEDVETDAENIQELVDSGDIVVLADNVEYFVDEMGIEMEDIVYVD